MKTTVGLLFPTGVISFIIAGYQFNRQDFLWSSFSVLYAIVFISIAWLNLKKQKPSVKETIREFGFCFFAFLVPFGMIFHPIMLDKQQLPMVKTMWLDIVLGFTAWIGIIIFYVFIK